MVCYTQFKIGAHIKDKKNQYFNVTQFYKDGYTIIIINKRKEQD